MSKSRKNQPEEPDEPADIPEVEVKGKRIHIGKKWFDLILCYLCPICKKPIIAYWKVTGDNKTDAGTVGRALRDSGFGGYRFFQTKDGGQGFEYDSEKDPRKRHQHAKTKEYGYCRYGGGAEYEILWINFIKLNPLFNVNDFFSRTFGEYSSDYAKTHQFVTSQATAVDVFMKKMWVHQDSFKVIEDIMGHGKPLFYFNLVIWEQKIKYIYESEGRLKELTNWFGEGAMGMLNLKTDFTKEE